MKYLALIMLLTVGCGSVDNNSYPDVLGEWEGVIYQEESWINSLHIRIADGVILGSHKMINTDTPWEFYMAVTGVLMGDEESFTAHMKIGTDPNNTWVYTGFVENKNLCLVRDRLPEPVRCLSPVE